MATAGKVAPTPKDKFINGEPYEKLDVVEYNGNLYIAKKASSGVLPTDTEYWMLAVDLSGKLDTTGDTENNTVTFESGDETEPTEWKSVNVLASKEKHSSLFAKISTMFSNVRYLYKLLGTTDITALGSVTEAIATISGNVGNMKGISSSAAITTEGEYALDAREKNASVEGTLANQIDVLNSNLDRKYIGTETFGDTDTAKLEMDFWECGNITFIDYRLKVYKGFASKDFGYISVTDKYPISKDTFLFVNTVGSVPEGDQAFVIRKTTGKIQAYRLQIGVYSGCIVY